MKGGMYLHNISAFAALRSDAGVFLPVVDWISPSAEGLGVSVRSSARFPAGGA